MAEIITFADFQTVWLASMELPVEENNFKSLCLYNDRVILNVPQEICEIFVQYLDKEHQVNPIRTRSTFISIDDVLDSADRKEGYVMSHRMVDELVGKDELENAFQIHLQEELIRTGKTIEEVQKQPYEMYEWYKLFYYSTMSILSNLSLYSKVRAKEECSITGFSRSLNHIIEQYVKKNTATEMMKIEKPITEAVEYALPNLKDISWNELFELRNDSRSKAFRDWINVNRINIAEVGLEQVIYKEFWKVLEDLKPNLSTNILKATFGNLPLPIPVNPLSIAYSAKGLSDDLKFNSDYSWLLFIHDIRIK